jgi:hypothetical protein
LPEWDHGCFLIGWNYLEGAILAQPDGLARFAILQKKHGCDAQVQGSTALKGFTVTFS